MLNGLQVLWNASSLASYYNVIVQIASPSASMPTKVADEGAERNELTTTYADMGPNMASGWHNLVYPGCWVRFGVSAVNVTGSSPYAYGAWVRVRGYMRTRSRGSFKIASATANVGGVNKKVAHVMVYKNGEWTESY